MSITVDVLDYTSSQHARFALHNRQPAGPLDLGDMDDPERFRVTADSGVLDLGGRPRTHDLLAQHEPQAYRLVVLPTDTLESIIGALINLCRARGRMNLLRVLGHGEEGVFLHGTLTEQSVQRHRATLMRLRPWFDPRRHPRAEVQLLGCYVGGRPGMLKALARLWGVPVSAGVDVQYSNLSGGVDLSLAFEGVVLTACPAADETSQVVARTEQARAAGARYADRCELSTSRRP
jgi:hypothetical protein